MIKSSLSLLMLFIYVSSFYLIPKLWTFKKSKQLLLLLINFTVFFFSLIHYFLIFIFNNFSTFLGLLFLKKFCFWVNSLKVIDSLHIILDKSHKFSMSYFCFYKKSMFHYGIMKKLLEMDSGDSCMRVWMKLMSLSCTL